MSQPKWHFNPWGVKGRLPTVRPNIPTQLPSVQSDRSSWRRCRCYSPDGSQWCWTVWWLHLERGNHNHQSWTGSKTTRKIHKGMKSIHVNMNVCLYISKPASTQTVYTCTARGRTRIKQYKQTNLFVFYEPDQTEKKQYFILKYKFTECFPQKHGNWSCTRKS